MTFSPEWRALRVASDVVYTTTLASQSVQPPQPGLVLPSHNSQQQTSLPSRLNITREISLISDSNQE